MRTSAIPQPKKVVEIDPRWQVEVLGVLCGELLVCAMVCLIQSSQAFHARKHTSSRCTPECPRDHVVQRDFGQWLYVLKAVRRTQIVIADAGAHEEVQALADRTPRPGLDWQVSANLLCFLVEPPFVILGVGVRNDVQVNLCKLDLNRTQHASTLISDCVATERLYCSEFLQEAEKVDFFAHQNVPSREGGVRNARALARRIAFTTCVVGMQSQTLRPENTPAESAGVEGGAA